MMKEARYGVLLSTMSMLWTTSSAFVSTTSSAFTSMSARLTPRIRTRTYAEVMRWRTPVLWKRKAVDDLVLPEPEPLPPRRKRRSGGAALVSHLAGRFTGFVSSILPTDGPVLVKRHHCKKPDCKPIVIVEGYHVVIIGSGR